MAGGGHRRLSTTLFLRYRAQPELLVALLEVDLDQAAGVQRSAREYAVRWHVRRSTAGELLEAYMGHVGELYPGRKAPPPRGQASLLLPYTGGRSGATSGATSRQRKPRQDVKMRETGSHSGVETGASPISPKIQENQNSEGAHARVTDSERAARALLAGKAERFDLEAIRKLASELPAERVAEVLLARKLEASTRSARERRARTVEALRHEGRRA